MMKTRAQKTLTTPHLSSIKRQNLVLCLPTAPSQLGCLPSLASSPKSSSIRRTRPIRGCAPVKAPQTHPWKKLKERLADREMHWSPVWLNWSWRAWWRREAPYPAAWAACRMPQWPACPSAPKLHLRPALWPAAQMRGGHPAGSATSTTAPATPPLITTQAAPATPTLTPTTAISSRLPSQAQSPPAPTSSPQMSSSSPAAALPTPRQPPSTTTRTCEPSALATRGRASSKKPRVCYTKKGHAECGSWCLYCVAMN